MEEAREAEKRVEEQRKREEEEARATKAFTQKEVEVLRRQLDEAKRKKELKRSRPESETEVEAELEKEGEERTGESAMMETSCGGQRPGRFVGSAGRGSVRHSHWIPCGTHLRGVLVEISGLLRDCCSLFQFRQLVCFP